MPMDADAPPPYRNADTAPFIYFDFAPTFGIIAGAIGIELAARKSSFPAQAARSRPKSSRQPGFDAARRRPMNFAMR